jgi:uncharacterized membrane protein
MKMQFTNPLWLLAWPLAVAWIVWLAWKSDVQIGRWRRWIALSLRLIIVTLMILAIAGWQWLQPQDGMNVFFVLDRSSSVPDAQQEFALKYTGRAAIKKQKEDRAGVVVFGSDASIASSANFAIDAQKIHAVVNSERTDIGAAIRLGTAAFPENGQKRIVLLSDGNENMGDAMSAALAAKPLGVSIDVMPIGAARGGDLTVQKLSLPNNLKKGQTFEVKILANADHSQTGLVRLFRNDQLLGEQKVELTSGKNLYTFPQTLTEPGFYSYDVQLDAPGDPVPQNNRATSFTYVRGNPRILLISSDVKSDDVLAAAIRSIGFEVRIGGMEAFPATLAEMQSYDAIFLSNIAAGDLGRDLMLLLQSAVRDFGTGLVCVGGDQAYGAGGYRSTPLEAALPLDMELSSKKVLPSGALVIACHATEFPNGNQWARDIAFAALDALSPQDEFGITLWDGSNRWLFPLEKVGNKREMGRLITGMMPGDMPDFQPIVQKAYEALKDSKANVKHMVVFSDGDPGAPSDSLLADIVRNRITISTVMIGGHVQPSTMMMMADVGKGRFYDVTSPGQLPQIFIKEAAVILKSAIIEEPFKPQIAAASELIRGIGSFPQLRGYVATSPKPRAEVPLLTEKGDPLLAHWQYGLGRAVAFTSDARAKWAADWMGWDRYSQFWSQIARWSLRRTDNAEFNSEVSVEKGEGHLSVEALDSKGNYRNFLNLQAKVVSPKGEAQTVRLEQTGPGRYEAIFPTRDIGAYLINLMDIQNGQLRGTQVLGASVNYSPEFESTGPNQRLLRQLAETTGGLVLNPSDNTKNPFLHDRQKTHQPRDLWEWLLKLAVILFTFDVAVRRVQLDLAEWQKATQSLRHFVFFWKTPKRVVASEESLAALLARRAQVRATTTAPAVEPNPDLFRTKEPVNLDGPIAGKPSEPKAVPTPSPLASPPKPGAGEESTTSRLLDAKRRAAERAKKK